MFIRLFSRFFLHRFSYTIFKRSIEPHSIGNSLNDVSLDSPIIQQYSFLIINTAEKDRLLSQLITGTLKKKKKMENLHKYAGKRPRDYLQKKNVNTMIGFYISFLVFLT